MWSDMEEFEPDFTELQNTIDQLLPGEFPITFEELVAGLMGGRSDGFSGFVGEIGDWLLSVVSFPVEQGKKLLLLLLFSALFSNFSKAFSKNGTSHLGFLCVYVLLAVQAVNGFAASFALAKEGMESLCSFVSVLLPTYCISIAFVTGSLTAAGYYQGTTFLLGLFEFLTMYCLLPLGQSYLILSVASCMQKRPVLERMLTLICSLFSWVRKTLIGIAMTLSAVQGILCPAIDSLKKTAVIRAATAIPGAGNLIQGAWETVLGAGTVLKNAIGIGGVIVLFLIGSLPLCSLFLQYVMYRVLAAVTEPVTEPMMGKLLMHLGSAHRLLLEVLFLGFTLFLLLLVVMTRITGG